MNDQDNFEAELAALVPRPPSARLHRALAGRLQSPVQAAVPNHTRTVARRAWRLSLALSISLAALAIVSLRQNERRVVTTPEKSPSAFDLKLALSPSLPTLWSFHLASTSSPEQLDALLDRHSGLGMRGTQGQLPASTFSIFTSTKQSNLGEL